MFDPFYPLPLVSDQNTEVPSQIFLDASLNIPLDFEWFGSLSDKNKQRALLNLPLPTLTQKNLFRNPSDLEISSLPPAMVGTYIMNNKTYKIPTQYFKNVILFSTCIHKNNIGDLADFDTLYVEPLILRFKNQDWIQLKLTEENQRMKYRSLNESGLFQLLDRHLYDVIESPLLHSLQLHQDRLTEGLDDFVNNGLDDLFDTMSFENTKKLEPVIFGNGSLSFLYMGVHCYPNLFIGFVERLRGQPISATAIGEMRLPTLCLGDFYDIVTEQSVIQGDTREVIEITETVESDVETVNFKIGFDKKTGFVLTNSPKINEVQETIRKLVTIGVLLGVNRLILTTYKDSVLIHVDPEFVRLGELKFKQGNIFGTKSLLFVKSTHYHLKSSDPLMRLKVLAFFDTTEESLLELQLFRDNVSSYLREKNLQLCFVGERLKVPSNASPNSCIPKTIEYQEEVLTAEKFTLNMAAFNTCQFLELGNMRTKFLQSGEQHSQVMVVNSQKLLSHLSPECISVTPTDDDIIIKVFDPYWANTDELSKEQFAVAYQNSIDMFTREFNLYRTLASLCGSVIPQYYGAFTVDDCTVSVGKPYVRVFGPSIMIQNLENMRHPNFKEENVDDEFIAQKIIPEFEKLHALGVIHGDFKWENIVVTNDYMVKIINFSLSHIYATRDETEIEKSGIYNYFGPQMSDSDESSSDFWD